jgi:hypothetical protein
MYTKPPKQTEAKGRKTMSVIGHKQTHQKKQDCSPEDVYVAAERQNKTKVKRQIAQVAQSSARLLKTHSVKFLLESCVCRFFASPE